jgi:CubicO group peptidase (beta-lactamase class C family)
MPSTAFRQSRRSFIALAATLAATGVPRSVRAAPAAGGEPPGAPAGPAADHSAAFQAVVERLQGAMAELGVPGAAIGILSRGQEEHAVLGVTSVETGAPVTPETLFAVGSITKTFTATALMRLVEAGAVDLDSPVRAVLPHLRLADESVAARVSLRHLLTHTAGWWGDYFTDTGGADDAVERFVAAVLPTLEQLAPLGAQINYNNSGFILLGRIIEVLTGRPYRQALDDLVLRPLGLRQSAFSPAEIERRSGVVGHYATPAGVVPVTPRYLPRNVDPAGGLWSTTREQLRYARFHLAAGAGGHDLLRRETVEQMQTIQVPFPFQPGQGIGLSWLLSQQPGLRLVNHDGDTYGQHASLLLVPEHDFAFSLLTNAAPGGVLATQVALTAALTRYGLVPGPATPPMAANGATGPEAPASPSTPALPPALPLPPETLAQYAGLYRLPSGTSALRVEGDTLRVYSEVVRLPGHITPNIPGVPMGMPELPQGLPLRFVREDIALLVADGLGLLPVIFLRRPDGSVGWLQVGLRLMPRVEPGPATAPLV